MEAEDSEALTAMEILSLSPDGGSARNFIGIATNNSFNEEVTSKGRVSSSLVNKTAALSSFPHYLLYVMLHRF